MIRTQISLTVEQMTRLRRTASAKGVSIAAVIRDAVDSSVPDEGPERLALQRRAFGIAGAYSSGHADTAERHDEALAEEPRW